MNAARAKRRWIAWCRYVAATGTRASGSRAWPADIAHPGQARAYHDHMFAGRSYPRGVRVPYFPKWGNP